MTFRPSLLVAALAAFSGCAHVAAADPRAQIRGEMDAELRRALERAVGEVDDAPESRFEARRRAEGAVAAATALLRSEGYYQPTVEDLVEGDDSPVAIVAVQPGRRFLLTDPTVAWTDPAPEAETQRKGREAIGLKAGDPGRAVDVIAGEGRLVAALVRDGYADATADPRRVVVDHAAYTVAPEYRIDSGALVRLNGVRVLGRGRTNPGWVAGLAPWEEGDRYDPDQVAELERRLLDTGVYDGVGVSLSPVDQTTPEGLRPVIVSLQDRPRRVLEAGATWSTAEGVGVDLIQTRYNRFGRADTLRLEARVADIDSRIGADLSLPHWRKPGRTLKLGAAVVNEDTDAYLRTALVLYADLQQRIGKTSYFNYGIGLDAGRYSETRYDYTTLPPQRVTFDRDLAIITARTSAYIDQSNDPLNPTKGWRVNLAVQPTAVTGESNILFLRTETQATAYMPVGGERTILAGRVRIGSIVGGSELNVPSDRLFYSGGGGSVRGYSYQGVNPQLPDGTPRGGLSLFETSLEARQSIGQSFQAVAFVDAGSIGFQETPNFSNMRYGAGVGVRYMLPFGPIRADVALPLNKREGDSDFQIYISIGQAF
ncbi:autotransporter assembly complex family protein [uncultured Brevundimonas sp.]|uniref:autotransporter assembly complex protein TamA n=1 Tax=uncultured Brevundimonas sp. TaxID=213418 RepID=UPI0025FD803E|nr:autotransporter assembly complex family protein [uncultured Brevundimonas sp.]